MTEILFPALSEKVPDAEGVVSTWFVSDGDQVQTDQLVAEVQVDKVAAEVMAPTDGTMRLLVPEEATVSQGVAIARIE
ncbi:MAG: biotin attachment protein [Streptosporangiales bacterium]|nr:biotin attachment protein [Streptosporangiales bacterium]